MGLGGYQPGVYVPLKALFLVLLLNVKKANISVEHEIDTVHEC